MVKSYLFLVLMLASACNTSSEQALPSSTNHEEQQGPFQFELALEQVEDDLYHLTATLDLEEKDYLISPFSTDSIYGSLSLSLNGERISYSRETLIELPESKEEYDPIIEDKVRRITEKTSFQYQVKLDKNQVETKGLFQFILEPICIPYEVNFAISKQAGKAQIKKTSTQISEDYKGGNKPAAVNIFKSGLD